MKRLLLALSLLLASPSAYGQVFVNTVLRPISPAQVQGVGATATAISSQLVGPWARVVCTVACVYAVRVSGDSVPATLLTGNYLPADRVDLIGVPRNSTISVIRHSTSGSIWVTDMGP